MYSPPIVLYRIWALERQHTPKKYSGKTPGQQRAWQTMSEVTGIVTV